MDLGCYLKDPTGLPPGMTRYQLHMRLDGHQGGSGRVRKISLLPGFDLRTCYCLRMRIISRLCVFSGIALELNDRATLDPISLHLLYTILALRMVFMVS